MSKRDWGFWAFWITAAGVAVTASLPLPSMGHPQVGRWLFYAGLFLFALLVLGALTDWVSRGLAVVSNPALRSLYAVTRFVITAFAWLGGLLLGPIITRTLKSGGISGALPVSWTAERKRGKNSSDFLGLSRPGCRLAGARFVIRPDYSFPSWHAGFRITRAADDLEKSDLKATLLVQITQAQLGGRVAHSCHQEGADYGPWGLQPYSLPTPSFEFDLSLYSTTDVRRLRITYSINGDTPQGLDFPREYAEQLVLVAWADGQDFRLYFDQISTSWAPTEEARG